VHFLCKCCSRKVTIVEHTYPYKMSSKYDGKRRTTDRSSTHSLKLPRYTGPCCRNWSLALPYIASSYGYPCLLTTVLVYDLQNMLPLRYVVSSSTIGISALDHDLSTSRKDACLIESHGYYKANTWGSQHSSNLYRAYKISAYLDIARSASGVQVCKMASCTVPRSICKSWTL
jgi:hypothetical protein